MPLPEMAPAHPPRELLCSSASQTLEPKGEWVPQLAELQRLQPAKLKVYQMLTQQVFIPHRTLGYVFLQKALRLALAGQGGGTRCCLSRSALRLRPLSGKGNPIDICKGWRERERFTSSPTFLCGNTPATLG